MSQRRFFCDGCWETVNKRLGGINERLPVPKGQLCFVCDIALPDSAHHLDDPWIELVPDAPTLTDELLQLTPPVPADMSPGTHWALIVFLWTWPVVIIASAAFVVDWVYRHGLEPLTKFPIDHLAWFSMFLVYRVVICFKDGPGSGMPDRWLTLVMSELIRLISIWFVFLVAVVVL